MKNLILYAYCKTDIDGEVALNFFLKYGVKQSNDYDYYFINTCKTNSKEELNVLLKLPPYFKILNRQNFGYDFGAWSDAILNIDITQYNYFIFLNNSSIGPCMPRYLKNIFWPELFYNHITSTVKLVGCTINYDGIKHVQSYCYCVDQIGLNILIKNKIFVKNLNKDKKCIIEDHEMKMLYYIENNGYSGYTFETVRNYDNISLIKNGNLSDGEYFKNSYFHEISPFEVIFVKQRLNHKNNSFLFYLKSMGFELINPKIEAKIIPSINTVIESRVKLNLPNKGIIIENDTKKIIPNQVISVKNILDTNKNKKIFNGKNKFI